MTPRGATGGGLARLSWRVLVDEPLPGAANMARDHALAELARPGRAALRFYRWARATLSIGRNEPFTDLHRGLLDLHPEVGAVRRPTGGRAVLHDRELTYSVVAPVGPFGGLRAAYRAINRALVEGLGRLGVSAELAGGEAPPVGAGACFAESAAGEVVAGGRKLVGSAQRRIRGTFLQHGSLLLADDQGALLASAAAAGTSRGDVPMGDVAARPATLAELLGAVPPWRLLATTLADGFAAALGGSWTRSSMTRAELALSELLLARYDSREWTRRREA